MDTYEKKYKELVAKIKNAHLYAQTDSTKNVLEGILPELQESEDEIIMQVLVDYFKRYKEQEECGIKTFYGIPTDNILAWLEKQNNKLIPKFNVGQRIRNCKGEMHAFVIDRIEDDSYKGENGESISVVFQDDWELVEQKPNDNTKPKFKVGDWVVSPNGVY